jgi:hypothetical protein
VLTLPRLHYEHLGEIIAEGRWTLGGVQGHSHLKSKHENYVQAARSGEPYVDKPEARTRALSELAFPLYFLDFEAIDTPYRPSRAPLRRNRFRFSTACTW